MTNIAYSLLCALVLLLATLAHSQPLEGARVVDPRGLGIAGLWYNPGLDGEGFSVVQSDAGITVYYYGYDARGEALWLVSDTLPAAATPGIPETVTAYRGTQGNFEGAALSASLETWGTVTFTVQDCDTALFQLNGNDGSKSSDTIRLAGVSGNDCRVRGESRSGFQYCEILLFYPEDDGFTAEVWGTQFIGDCPDEDFAALDAEAIRQQYGASFIKMNGPRQALADYGQFASTGDQIRRYGELDMAQHASLVLTQDALNGGGAYVENTAVRVNRSENWAGKEIYLLTSDTGAQYFMLSMAKTVDPDQSLDQLPTLGSRLQLPSGWRWEAVTLEEDLIVEVNGTATVISDDFENTYQRLEEDKPFGLAGLWYQPSRDGEGFNVIQSDAGTTVYFYGYDAAGEPLWLVSDTDERPLGSGDARVLSVFRGDGGTFDNPVPGPDLTEWGSLILVAEDCGNAWFELNGADGLKTSEAVKLADIRGSGCTDTEILETPGGVKFVRTPDEAFENLPDWPYEARYVEIDGLRQAYAETGPADGPVALLLHGQPSWSYLYRKMMPVLAEGGMRVIAMDHLGLGRSDKPIDVEAYSYLGHSDRLEAFIQQLGHEDINLFVQDWGSLIGLRVAGLNPDWFASITVGNGILPDLGEGEQPYPVVEDTDRVLDLPSPYAIIPDQQVPFYNGCEPRFPREDESYFGVWMEYAMKGISFQASDTLEANTWFDMPAEDEAAYDAPFPSRIYMAGIRKFPSLINEVPGQTSEALDGLTSYTRPFLTIWATNDPGAQGSCEAQQFFIDNVPGAAGQPHDRLPEASHFLQDDQGQEIATRMLEFYDANGITGSVKAAASRTP